MRKKSCNCSDPDCKRVVKSTYEGKLYIINNFTCGIIKEQILRLSKIKIQ